jgi:D-serine deaminase-like pyridoxal phosphate-dependent protein
MFVAATVVSNRHKSHVTVDAGIKALSMDGPPAKVVAGAASGSLWRSMGDEHGMIAHPDLLDVLKAGGRDPLAFARAISAADADPTLETPADAPKRRRPRLAAAGPLRPDHQPLRRPARLGRRAAGTVGRGRSPDHALSAVSVTWRV